MQNNQKLLKTIIDNLDDLICVIEANEDFKIDFLNEPLYQKVLGYSRKDLLNTSLLSIIHPDDREKVRDTLIHPFVTSEDKRECRIKTEKGKYVWFEFHINKRHLNQTDSNILIVLNVIEKQKALEEKVKESEEKLKKLTQLIPEIRFWKLFSPKKFEEALRTSYEMLETVIESIPQYIAWKDLNLEYLGCNQNFAEFIGINQPENIIGKKDKNLTWFEDNNLTHYESQERKVLKDNQPEFNIIESWNLQKKTKQWVNVNRIPLHDSKGYVVGLLITYEDITKRIIADKKLKESEQKYRHLFDNSHNMILLSDTQGNFIDVNEAFLEFTGYEKKELISENFKNINYYPANLSLLQNSLKIIREKGSIGPIEVQLQNKEEDFRWFSVRASLTEIDNQKLIHIIMEDIHERKLAENQIKESEERYRDLLETSSVGIIELDLRKQEILYINPKLLQILGYEQETSDGEEIVKKIIKTKGYNKILKASDEEELEFQIHDKFGKLKWLSGKKVTHYNERGELISFRLWLEDETDKKMYEKILYELNINFLNFTTDIRNNIFLLLYNCKSLLNSALVVYVLEDIEQDGDIFRVMTSEKETFLVESSEFFKTFFMSKLFLESHDFPQIFMNIDESEYKTTDPFFKSKLYKGCYGRRLKTQKEFKGCLCAFFTENPTISNYDQYVLFLISVAIDIEKRRWEGQKHLEKQNIMLSDISKLKTELLSRTSHELKTPLISIKGFTELLLTVHSGKLDTDVMSILSEIKNGSNRLEKIINSLLESSKLEQNKLMLKREVEDLTFLIKYCIKEVKGLIDLREQNLILDLSEDLITKFDKERIYEVFSNILINAIKYTPPKGTIRVKSELTDGFYIISVQDNGIGFTEEEKTRIFKQFGKIERYGKGWDLDIEGTGLGLYISKKLIELHGGEIWMESEGRNRGSTFCFSLPIER